MCGTEGYSSQKTVTEIKLRKILFAVPPFIKSINCRTNLFIDRNLSLLFLKPVTSLFLHFSPSSRTISQQKIVLLDELYSEKNCRGKKISNSPIRRTCSLAIH